jgi:hypothetical protein
MGQDAWAKGLDYSRMPLDISCRVFALGADGRTNQVGIEGGICGFPGYGNARRCSNGPTEARGWQGISKGGVAVADLLEREP